MAPEDSHHLLWNCSILRQLWDLLNLSFDFSVVTSDGKSQFVSSFLAFDQSSKKLITISLWALWYKINKLVNEGLNFRVHDLKGFVQSYALKVSSSTINVSSMKDPMNDLWQPPTARSIKLNFDASFSSTSDISILAVLARDAEGQIMGACTYPLMDVPDAFVAEARACERALYYAMDMGFRNLIVEGDSLTTIKKLNSHKDDKSILRPITQNIRVLERSFEKVVYRFVPREVNRAAHALAMDDRHRNTACFWVEDAPDPIAKLLSSKLPFCGSASEGSRLEGICLVIFLGFLKVRFKESDASPNDMMVVDPIPEPSLSWKDMLVGKETLDLTNKNDGQHFVDSFALTEQDVKKYFIDGVSSIDFLERFYQLLEKEMSTYVVLKMLGRNLGITTLQNRLYGIWRPSKPFQVMDIENDYFLTKF
ncbi:hypothetical protein CXB51_034666 [Gossypium anomalum]|uniref:RNase H type-1 domain-containing protein n=1 Tax=Gossypium anomalum TaxID=47600 RepID=A0A8J5XXU3_9ROSI|nr:hypothetical protein CXB51_034666 [Gossypium anomalum]